MSGVIIFLLLGCIIGGIICFRGRRLISFALPAAAFLLSANFIYSRFADSQYVLIIALIIGIIAALLTKFARKLAFFILGAFIGAWLGGILLQYIPVPDQLSALGVLAAAAVITGLLFTKWDNLFIACGTAILGGNILSTILVFAVMNLSALTSYEQADPLATIQSLGAYLQGSFQNQYDTYLLLVTIIFALLGIFAQTGHRYRH